MCDAIILHIGIPIGLSFVMAEKVGVGEEGFRLSRDVTLVDDVK